MFEWRCSVCGLRLGGEGGPLAPKGLLANFWGSGAHVLTMDTLRACVDSFDGSDISTLIGIKFRHSMECQCG